MGTLHKGEKGVPPTTMSRLEMPGYSVWTSQDRVKVGGVGLSPESGCHDSVHRTEMW